MLAFAVGVLEALIIYASWISCLAALVVLKCLETCARRWLEAFIGDMAIRTDMVMEVREMRGVILEGININRRRIEVKMPWLAGIEVDQQLLSS